MSNPNLVRKPAIDSGGVGEISTNQVGSYSSNYKNYWINGNFDVWQRGTSFTLSGSGQVYAADRWVIAATNTGAGSITRSTSVPNIGSSYSLLYTVTTADTSVAATDYQLIGQRIEGLVFKELYGKTFTVSFWVKGSTTGTYTFQAVNGAGTRSYITSFDILSTNTWEFKTITINHDITGVWNLDNQIGMQCFISVMTGTAWQGTPNVWQNGNIFGVPTQVNMMATVGNYIQISQMMLNLGSAASPFQTFNPGYIGELAVCQRYYEKITIQPNSYPAQYTTVGNIFFGTVLPFLVEKRANPTMSYTHDGNAFYWVIVSFQSFSANDSSGCLFDTNTKTWRLYQPRLVGAVTPTAGNLYILEATFSIYANSEL